MEVGLSSIPRQAEKALGSKPESNSPGMASASVPALEFSMTYRLQLIRQINCFLPRWSLVSVLAQQ